MANCEKCRKTDIENSYYVGVSHEDLDENGEVEGGFIYGFQLCPECYEKFEEFIYGGWIDENIHTKTV